jgi:hypothetical protein
VLLLILFIGSLAVYCGGSFAYPWLEDDDPWWHAAGIKYICLEKNVNVPSGVFQYIKPYPPGYDLIFAILHQTSPSLIWTLKFFNGFIISLGFLFFFYWIKEWTLDSRKALLATFFLASMPCYLSHFIWAHALVVTLFFPAFYLTLKSGRDRNFVFPAAIVLSGIFLTQPTKAIKFTCLWLILLGVSTFLKRRLPWHMIMIFTLGFVLSILFWWLPIAIEGIQNNMVLTTQTSLDPSGLHAVSITSKERILDILRRLFDPASGSATRPYRLNDYLFFPKPNMINNPIGVGAVLCVLGVVGLIYFLANSHKGSPDEQIYKVTILGWLFFTFLGMNSLTFRLPIGLFAFRFWMLFALPVSIVAAEGTLFLKSMMRSPTMKRMLLGIVIVCTLASTTREKIRVNTAAWDAGRYWTFEDLEGFFWLKHHFKMNTKVFAFTQNFLVIGLDMLSDFWRPEYKDAFQNAMDLDVTDFYQALKRTQYRYVIIGQRDIERFGENRITQKVASLRNSGYFQLEHNPNDHLWVFKVL